MSEELDKQDRTDKKDAPRIEDQLAHRQEFLQMFKRGAEFSEELLKENERLRMRIAELDRKPRSTVSDDGLVKELMEKIRRVEEERDQLVERFSVVEAENKDFASRYVRVETENNSLLAIYVASYQLHSTLDFNEVLQIITEIILNFVGAEVFAITLLDEATGGLLPLVAEGIERDDVAKVSVQEGTMAKVLQSGEPHYVSDIADLKVLRDEPGICIPLKIKERTIGAIMVYRFLPQKKQLAHVDHELFTLLAGHAATAIFSSKLYSDSRRKLNTIQGLIDLVTS